MNNDIESFCPSSKQDWRNWLELNHKNEEAIWLIIHKKGSSKPNLTWSDAVDEALCFGWIDSVKRSIDSEKYTQYFTKRKAKSNWSKINKDKIVKLKELGLMTEAGLKSIEIAQQNGSWTILDSVENHEIPIDLEEVFNQSPEIKDYFFSLSKSVRKTILYWIVVAKRPETRHKRLNEIVENAKHSRKPKQFR